MAGGGGFDWLDHAACSGMNPDLFFPADGRKLDRAVKAVCARCPVAGPCDEFAAASGSSGVWGGRPRRGRSARLGRAGEAA